MTYSEKLKDPRWQKKRLEVLGRAGFKCENCESEGRTLHVHHRYYVSGRDPWEYPDFCFQSLCLDCHEGLAHSIGYKEAHGQPIFEDWEIGLNHFGLRIINMALDEIEKGNVQ